VTKDAVAATSDSDGEIGPDRMRDAGAAATGKLYTPPVSYTRSIVQLLADDITC